MSPAQEFQIKPQIAAGLRRFIYSQLFITPPYPTQSFAGQTIIVTGSNTGLGLEAARHFFRLGCARLILAVRNVGKGESAKELILSSVPTRHDHVDSIEVWELDLSSTKSTLEFAEKAKRLGRLDVLLENAGIATREWGVSEGVESMVQVNVLNTFLLALSLLPTLQDTKTRFPDSEPHLTVVSSEAHRLTAFKDVNALDIYARLNDKNAFVPSERYAITKLLEILLVRELVKRLPKDAPEVVINTVNPGLCASGIDRAPSSLLKRVFVGLLGPLLFRSAEVGGRTLVIAAGAGKESHGKFMADGALQDIEGWIESEIGGRVQEKVWVQTMKMLEGRKGGVGGSLGLSL